MTVTEKDEAVRAWYLGSNDDVAKIAYDEAIDFLKRELKGRPQALAWIEEHRSLDNIRAEVEDVEEQYRTAGATKKTVLGYMRKICSWIMFYGQILDTLAQHHPEYVSLAWGSVKFVLIGVLNHEKVTTQISEALRDISNALPRTELHAKLYPTERMKASMAQLYAHLVLFLRQAVQWFSRHPAGRAVSALVKPFEIKYKPLIDQIWTCTKTIDEEASAASKAEIRGLRWDVQQHGESIAGLGEKLDEADKAHHQRFDIIDIQLKDVRSKMEEISGKVTTVQGSLGDTQARVIDLQLNEVMNNLRPKVLPEEILSRQQALVKRGNPWIRDSQSILDIIQRLSNWMAAPATPLLILQAGPQAQANAKELAIELIGVLEPADTAVIWHLVDTGRQEEALSRADVIRSLIFQLTRLVPELMIAGTTNLDAARLQGKHSDDEWLEILSLILGRFPQCFLLVEAESGPGSSRQAEEFLFMLENLVSRCQGSSCQLKLMLLSGQTDLSSSVKCSDTSTIVTVQRPTPPPPHLRRIRTGQKARTLAWSGIRKKQ